MSNAHFSRVAPTRRLEPPCEVQVGRTVTLFDIPIASVTLEQALDRIHMAIVGRERLELGVVNAAKIVNMKRDPELRDAVCSADVIYADGMSVVWASRILRTPLPERVTGIDLMYGILRRGAEHRYRIFCLGATSDVVRKVGATLAADYPGIQVVGCANGYFSADEEEGVAAAIREARPDVLFVGITSPKKERFIARWSDSMDVPVVHGVGGSFDIVAGLTQRAPELWQKLGLEWLYRFKQEPGRLWRRYLVTNVAFMWMVLRERIRRLTKSR